jgi:hypothetical protein
MPLALHPRPTSAPDTDHLVMNGGLAVGRIYRRDTPDKSDSQWLWAINGVWAEPAIMRFAGIAPPLNKPRLSCKKTGRSGWLGPISRTSAARLRSNLRLHGRPLRKSSASRSSLSLHRQPLMRRSASPRLHQTPRESANRLMRDGEGQQVARSRNKWHVTVGMRVASHPPRRSRARRDYSSAATRRAGCCASCQDDLPCQAGVLR